MIDARSVQHALAAKGFYKGAVDGRLGPASAAAIDRVLAELAAQTKLAAGWRGWTAERKLTAFQQLMMSERGLSTGAVDGIAGPRFQYALEQWQNLNRDLPAPPEVVAHKPAVWPRQADMVKFYGQPGANQTRLSTPYPLYLDWQLSAKVGSFQIHEKCHDSALRVMQRVLSHYGPAKIHELGLDQFGGCLNVRKMRGGNAWSMHSWGTAIDWDADRNPLRGNHRTARFSVEPQTHKFLDLWEEEGWTSLGRERDFDWMHVQAARL